MVWLFSKEYKEEYDEEPVTAYHLAQQIPRDIPSFKKKMECIKSLEGELYLKLRRQQGFKNYCFDILEILDDKMEHDVWVIYESYDDLDKFYSLSELLWQV